MQSRWAKLPPPSEQAGDQVPRNDPFGLTDDKRARIIDAAINVFAKEGLHAARIDEIAAAAGVAKGTLYLYFFSKEQLFVDAIRERLASLVKDLGHISVATEQPADLTLRLQIDHIYRALFSERIRVILRLVITEGPRFPELITYYYDNVARTGLDALRDTLRRGVEEGVFAQQPIEELPRLIIGPALLAALWKQIFDHIDPLRIEVMAERHYKLLIDGLRA